MNVEAHIPREPRGCAHAAGTGAHRKVTRRRSVTRRVVGLGLVAIVGVGLAGCGSAESTVVGAASTNATPGVGPYSASRPVRVIATTPLIADVVRNVGGDRVQVSSMVPVGADPHAYEPGLRAIRDVAYADLAISNYMMLEEHSLIQTIDSSTAPGVRHVSLAEGATRHGGEVISMTENAALDTAWVGLRVIGTGAKRGLDRASSVRMVATQVEGPGNLSAYITETFGNPSVFFDSGNGIQLPQSGAGEGDDGTDAITLPTDAHTHMSWAFTKPGIYKLHVRAETLKTREAAPQTLAEGVVTFAVGVDPRSAASSGDATILTQEHADISADVDAGKLVMRVDPVQKGRRSDAPTGRGGETAKSADTKTVPLTDVVVEVPNKAIAPVPADPAFRFIEKPGTDVYQLPQAVLGKHVHGEIDPHLWMDVRNVKAYSKLIQDELTRLDPAGAVAYRAATAHYLSTLDALDAEVTRTIDAIPERRRHLVTTHDAFGYLSHAYGIPVAGVVTPSAATEPSVADRSRIVRTLTTLGVPAVFVSPTEMRTNSVLVDVARDMGIKACPLLSDTFTPDVRSYVDLMRFDARSLKECLS